DGTYLLKDLTSGSASSSLSNFFLLNGSAYFVSNGLWKTDGTLQGTVMIDATVTGVTSSFVEANLFYFVRNTTTAGDEVWRTDGSPNGAFMLKDINPGTASSSPSSFTIFNG